jgi:hypothetical protein
MPVSSPTLFYNPPVAQAGGPRVTESEGVSFGGWFVNLRSSDSQPSSANALRSFGVETRPVDNSGRLQRRPTQLFVSTSITIDTSFFYTTGVFATARTAAYFRYYVEEFDASFRYVRAVEMPGEIVVVRQDFWWFSGSSTFPPESVGSGWTIPNPLGGILIAQPNFFYRIWIDLHAEIRAQGFGGLGGSGAIAQLGWSVDLIDVGFM